MRFATDSRGFTVLELMVVVLVIGILVAIGIPVFSNATSLAARRSCASNQRMIEGAREVWLASNPTRDGSELAGLIAGTHPLIAESALLRPPVCPSGPGAADPANPTAAEGAYALAADGSCESCTFGGGSHTY